MSLTYIQITIFRVHATHSIDPFAKNAHSTHLRQRHRSHQPSRMIPVRPPEDVRHQRQGHRNRRGAHHQHRFRGVSGASLRQLDDSFTLEFQLLLDADAFVFDLVAHEED